MALQKELAFAGFTTPTGYFRVTEVRYSRERNATMITLSSFASAEEAAKENPAVLAREVYTAEYNPEISDSGNVVAAAYEYVKALPAFAESIDV